MARSLEWRELRLGIISVTAVAALAIGTLFFARVGQLRGETTTIYVYSDDAVGVLPGTEVWLGGQKVGQVKRVHFRPVTTDTLRRLAIETQILRRFINHVRHDARVDIRPGANLIGTPVIYFQQGTSRAAALTEGDTIAAISSSAFKPLGARVESLNERMAVLADTAKRLAALINSASGTLGALKESGLPQVPRTFGTMERMMTQATQGDGTIGLAMRNDLGARIARLGGAKDSITALLASDGGNLGRFQKDSTLPATIAHIKSQVDSLKMRFAGNGTVARTRTDSALTKEMAKMSAELAALMAEVAANPRRFIAF